SLKELAKRWFPRVYYNVPAKNGGHRALADIRESIQELKYYREVLFAARPGPTTARAQEAARTFALEDDGGGEAGSLPAPGPHVPWLDLPAHRTWLEGEGDELLVFGSESVRDDGGFAW